MNYLSLRILQTLHDEHLATLGMLERLENLLRDRGPQSPARFDDPAAAKILGDMIAIMEEEIGTHFGFEEEHLFPIFAEHADMGIPMMLKGEHDAIRPLARKLVDIAKGARKAGAFAPEAWSELYYAGMEMVEREVFHVQKEEMGFLPALDQMLDDGAAAQLEMAYAQKKGG
jgi:hemerythrin-like domain-containing protein